MSQKITVTKVEDHYEMQFGDSGSSYPAPTNAIENLDDELTPDALGDSVTFVGDYGGHKHMKTFDVEEVVDESKNAEQGQAEDDSAETDDDDDDMDSEGIDPESLGEGDKLVRTTTGGYIKYEVVDVTEERTFNGTETVVIITKNGIDEETIYERKQDNFKLVENTEADGGRLMTDGGQEPTECVHCNTKHAPESGIVTGKPEVGDDRTCNICLQDHLRESTVLSRRESEVGALKLLGYQHEPISDILQAWRGEDKPAKSTVDEYSSRINAKIKKSAETVNLFERYL